MLPEIDGENEVSLEWFSRLKEYDSLTKSRLGHLNAIKDQDSRVIALQKRLDESLAQLSNLKADYVRHQQELLELESQMKVLTQQKERWIDQGGPEEKRRSMETEIAKLEDHGLALLELLETNEAERKDSQTFIEGIGKTITEVRAEAKAEITNNEEAIRNLDLRLQGVLDVLPGEFKDLLLKTLKKNLALGPFTRMDNGSCFFCRFKISKNDENEIDLQQKLKVCPQCSRIFIPYGT